MTSTNGSSEAADTSAASGPRDPLQFAHTLVQKFAALSFASQFREQLYAFLQGIFLLGSFYKVRPDEYRQFADLEYWRNVRQKPNERNIMRSLLGFTMRTKEPGREALQNRVYKYARVLEYFYQNDFISDEVPQRLKDGGGIDAIYAALCRNAGMRTGRGASPEGSLAELPRATEDDETTETRAVALQGHDGHVTGGDRFHACQAFHHHRLAGSLDRAVATLPRSAVSDGPNGTVFLQRDGQLVRACDRRHVRESGQLSRG